jgi:hypothetical protein
MSWSFGSGLKTEQLSGSSLLPPERNLCAIITQADFWFASTCSGFIKLLKFVYARQGLSPYGKCGKIYAICSFSLSFKSLARAA